MTIIEVYSTLSLKVLVRDDSINITDLLPYNSYRLSIRTADKKYPPSSVKNTILGKPITMFVFGFILYFQS